MGELDQLKVFTFLLSLTEVPYHILTNNCKHVAIKIYDYLTGIIDNNRLVSSFFPDNGGTTTFTNKKELETLFNFKNIDISSIKTSQILMEKRYCNKHTFQD